MSLLIKSLLYVSLISTLTSCYRMPEPDEYSLIPSTNNPSYTREAASQAPTVGY